jgi:hypothetical protein
MVLGERHVGARRVVEKERLVALDGHLHATGAESLLQPSDALKRILHHLTRTAFMAELLTNGTRLE